MELVFHVQEPANVFSIIDDLSDWDMHTVRSIKRLYEAQFGASEEDSAFLAHYQALRKRSGWSSLDSAFIPARTIGEALEKAKGLLFPIEHQILEKVIGRFRDDAAMLYYGHRSRLELRKASLEREVKSHDLPGLIERLAKFYETRSYPTRFHVHLLVNTCDGSGGGGANVGTQEDTTLLPHCPGKDVAAYIDSDLAVSAHEIGHLIESRAPMEKLDASAAYLDSVGIGADGREIFREAIMDSLLPHGVLALDYGLSAPEDVASRLENAGKTIIPHRTDRRRYYSALRERLGAAFYPLSKETIGKGETLFQNSYIRRAAEIFLATRPRE
ncbi:hypothetical protein JXB02_01800 [Candidatus Woesearchaeota archaeon]|nr:hypothetical protein [Candidatus Woesearchaeota archaeon]